MVTNLPAEAKAKWIKVMEAKTPEEKIRALEDFLSSVPKHKGTEKLRLWATKRLAELREEVEEKRKRRVGRGISFFVEKEGAAQIAVVGLPNSGKSLLVNKLTGAKTLVAEYPFSTTAPVPGMLKYEDLYFQLIDLPPLLRDSHLLNKVIGVVRNADGILVLLDATRDPVSDFEEIREILEDFHILVKEPRGRVVLESYRAGKQGIRITLMGRLVGATADDVRKLLESYRIFSAHVKIYGEVTLDDVEQSIFEDIVYRPPVIFINKADAASSIEGIRELEEKYPEIPVILGSALEGRGLERIGSAIFSSLKLIRVYTKSPNSPPSPKPLVLKRGATVYDVAMSIHKDFVDKFLYARIWGRSANYPGEKVGMDHQLEDRDIVEIHIRG